MSLQAGIPSGILDGDLLQCEDVHRVYPVKVSPLFRNLLEKPGDPIWRQVMPDVRELRDEGPLAMEDPLGEEARSPVPNLVHRYPDRVLWIVSHVCAVHCRFCTRKRRWTRPVALNEEMIQRALDYIARTPAVRDVLLSGGDPLMLSAAMVDDLCSRLRRISHVRILRVGTRVPFAAPERITDELVGVLRGHHPLFVNIHVNHPREITPEAREACARLADAGIPLGSQTVLLRDVNDDPSVLEELFVELLSLRVRPYYLLQMDLMKSTAHFRTGVSDGLRLLQRLRNRISGLALPQFVVDLPGGYGKVPLLPQAVEKIEAERIVFRNYEGRRCSYPLVEGEGPVLAKLLGKDG